MSAVDGLLVVLIISFIILMIWSKLQHQRMLDTLNEIKEFIQSVKE